MVCLTQNKVVVLSQQFVPLTSKVIVNIVSQTVIEFHYDRGFCSELRCATDTCFRKTGISAAANIVGTTLILCVGTAVSAQITNSETLLFAELHSCVHRTQ